MGLYWIPCRACQKVFYWFSGNMDQRCPECKAKDLPKQDPLPAEGKTDAE